MRYRATFILFASILPSLLGAQNASAATIYVTYLAQKVAGQGTGGCSLQEAIYSSILHDSLDGVHGIAINGTDPDTFITTDCVKGEGNDTIVLPTGGQLTMNADVGWDAYNPFGPTATPLIFFDHNDRRQRRDGAVGRSSNRQRTAVCYRRGVDRHTKWNCQRYWKSHLEEHPNPRLQRLGW